MFTTQFLSGTNTSFYKIKDEVKHNGEFIIYSPHLEDDPIEVVYEMLRLKAYFQIMHPGHIDARFKESIPLIRMLI